MSGLQPLDLPSFSARILILTCRAPKALPVLMGGGPYGEGTRQGRLRPVVSETIIGEWRMSADVAV